jgi:TonB family protein
MKISPLRRTFLAVLVSLSCCSQGSLRVEQLPEPDYPSAARYANIQGTVDVKVWIGTDGKVIASSASGDNPILIEAADNNARQWRFGPFPPVSEFPIEHTIRYIFKLEGHPIVIGVRPTVKTNIPNMIEIKAVPLVSDYPAVKKDKD